jgi:heat-inducible transcriptional repressor
MLLLRKVVEGYVESGQPVGSKWLAASADVSWGPSTVRHELAVLEEHGLLAHPHTSAGRVPTDAGYRHFVDELLAAGDRPPEAPRGRMKLSLVRRELDEALQVTTETLSQVTNLLAIVSAPPLETTTIRHVEVLILQPQLLMVVVITSTGGVTKRMFTFEEPIDTGLADWAASYLNERLVGMGLGARMLHSRLAEPSLSSTEREFLETLAPAFTHLAATAEDTLYMDGAGRLLSEERMQDLSQINELMTMLERRAALLGLLSFTLDRGHVSVRIGHELEAPALRSVALVASGYGLPARNLGMVSVLGPLRMDYATAIVSVRDAAGRLSRFFETVYEG